MITLSDDSDDFKRMYALDLAHALADGFGDDESNVNVALVSSWNDADLYEWLGAWGYEWKGGSWRPVLNVEW